MTTSPFSAFELKAGRSYRVKASFVDHDGSVHPIGETWRYDSHAFIPYHAGLTLNVTDANGARHIRLQDYPEAQGQIVAHFSNYVEETAPLPGIVADTPSPPILVPPTTNVKLTDPAVAKGIRAGAAVAIFMSLTSWIGLRVFGDKPNAFGDIMTLLNLPSVFIAFGDKQHSGGYMALAILIIVQWSIFGGLVGLMVARRARRKTPKGWTI